MMLELFADNPIPNFSPELPQNLTPVAKQILAWTAGGGLVLAVLGALVGWALSGIGEYSERSGLAARGKRGIVVCLFVGVGISVTSGLVWTFYSIAGNA